MVVQCLWQCTEFREKVSLVWLLLHGVWDELAGFIFSWLPGYNRSQYLCVQVFSLPVEAAAADPVVAALSDLFRIFETEASETDEACAAVSQPVVDPTALREALSALPGRLFQVGEMSDAGEVLLAIYDCIAGVTTSRGLPAIVDHVFGLHVSESVHCSACGKGSHESSYVQYFYNVPATGLRLAGMLEGHSSMGRLLRWVESQQEKSCDTDVGGCGTLNRVNQFLQRPPRVFSMQLAWESATAGPDDIAATMENVEERVS